jgi:hypothetical protein
MTRPADADRDRAAVLRRGIKQSQSTGASADAASDFGISVWERHDLEDRIRQLEAPGAPDGAGGDPKTR